MLNSCGHALSQGDGSDFHPRCNWEATPPGYRACGEALEKIGSTPWGHACPDILWQPSKAGRIQECWQVELIVGGVGNGAAKEDGCWDLNLGVAALEREDHEVLGEKGEDHAALAK